jgi:acetyl-CoA carboxylase carboxyl transferase subunit alpha
MPLPLLPFEKPVVDLLERLAELRTLGPTDALFAQELARLEEKTVLVAREMFAALSAMDKVLLSRHSKRPYTLDYIERLFTDWVELHGDRRFADDAAIVGGLCSYCGRSVVVIGHQKGRTTKENVKRNFGMPHPEGYRKAIRLYELADRFGLPVLTLVDTPGAYPGIGAEERGQSEAIGSSLAALSMLRVPVIATIIGEGGSGGALAMAMANRVLMLEYSSYSVISPEGCAAILWKDASRAAEAATQLRLTAPELLRLRVIDAIVQEPPGGAHRDHDGAAKLLDNAIRAQLEELLLLSPDQVAEDRYQRFRRIGVFSE